MGGLEGVGRAKAAGLRSHAGIGAAAPVLPAARSRAPQTAARHGTRGLQRGMPAQHRPAGRPPCSFSSVRKARRWMENSKALGAPSGPASAASCSRTQPSAGARLCRRICGQAARV